MNEDAPQIHPSACVDAPCDIGPRTRIWHFCHVMAGARIGADCVLGQNVFVAAGVVVGDRVRVQNNVSLYAGTVVECDVFLGPSCVLTNVSHPRAEVSRKTQFEPTRLRRGATLGANATLTPGTTVGRYAFVGAGAVVTADVPDYGFVLGVPGRQVGFVSRHGRRLDFDPGGLASCPETGLRYQLDQGRVRCLDLDEEAPLPHALAQGRPTQG